MLLPRYTGMASSITAPALQASSSGQWLPGWLHKHEQQEHSRQVAPASHVTTCLAQSQTTHSMAGLAPKARRLHPCRICFEAPLTCMDGNTCHRTTQIRRPLGTHVWSWFPWRRLETACVPRSPSHVVLPTSRCAILCTTCMGHVTDKYTCMRQEIQGPLAIEQDIHTRR
jgi:hypothetical protein